MKPHVRVETGAPCPVVHVTYEDDQRAIQAWYADGTDSAPYLAMQVNKPGGNAIVTQLAANDLRTFCGRVLAMLDGIDRINGDSDDVVVTYP